MFFISTKQSPNTCFTNISTTYTVAIYSRIRCLEEDFLEMFKIVQILNIIQQPLGERDVEIDA